MLNKRFFKSRLSAYRGKEFATISRRVTTGGQHVLEPVYTNIEVDHQQRPIMEGDGDIITVSISIDVFSFAFGTDVLVNDIIMFNDTEFLVADVLSEGMVNRQVQVLAEAVPNAV